MTYITQIVMGLSAAAIFIGAMFMLSPSGNMHKSVRYIFTLVFLCACVSLFLKTGKVDFKSFSSERKIDYTSALKLTETQAERICAAALNDNNISFNKISVITDINESSGIFISNVFIRSDANPDQIKKIIKQTVITKEVTVE